MIAVKMMTAKIYRDENGRVQKPILDPPYPKFWIRKTKVFVFNSKFWIGQTKNWPTTCPFSSLTTLEEKGKRKQEGEPLASEWVTSCGIEEDPSLSLSHEKPHMKNINYLIDLCFVGGGQKTLRYDNRYKSPNLPKSVNPPLKY